MKKQASIEQLCAQIGNDSGSLILMQMCL